VSLLVIPLILLSSFASAEVVVFRNYITKTTLNKAEGILQIERTVHIHNTGGNPIIPGELHFKLHEIKGEERVASTVENFEAARVFSENNKRDLKTRIVKGERETDLVINVWEPMLPNDHQEIYLTYDMKFSPKGFLFYQMDVPIEETTIPIKNNEHNLYIPAGYHVTFAPNSTISKQILNDKRYRVVTWKNRKDMFLEFTRLPMPRLGIKAVNIFWLVIIVSLLISTFFIHRTIRRRMLS
jgi:hypothetical protein